MPITKEQLEKIQNHLSLLPSKKCNMCNEENWAIESELAIFPLFDISTRTIIEGQVYPLVLLSCMRCGNTVLFNAKSIGL
jgi:hypothetical protein